MVTTLTGIFMVVNEPCPRVTVLIINRTAQFAWLPEESLHGITCGRGQLKDWP